MLRYQPGVQVFDVYDGAGLDAVRSLRLFSCGFAAARTCRRTGTGRADLTRRVALGELSEESLPLVVIVPDLVEHVATAQVVATRPRTFFRSSDYPDCARRHRAESTQVPVAPCKRRWRRLGALLFTVNPTRGRVIPMAKAAVGGDADSSVADQLRALGAKGVLVQLAERGQLLALKCEMPQCYHHKGRGAFDPVTTPRTKWAPSPDHYPILKSAGGHLVPENVRLSHVWCNNLDYARRTQIRRLLAKGKSLAEIAEALNSKGVPPSHGTNQWTAAMVRKAYVS